MEGMKGEIKDGCLQSSVHLSYVCHWRGEQITENMNLVGFTEHFKRALLSPMTFRKLSHETYILGFI